MNNKAVLTSVKSESKRGAFYAPFVLGDKNMQWYALNKEYVNYLKIYDDIVPNIEYTGRLKCFLGIIIKSTSGLDYFAPLTSYKPKFKVMSNDITELLRYTELELCLQKKQSQGRT